MKTLAINRQFFTIILVILALVGVNSSVRSEAYTIMLSQDDIKTSGSDKGKVVKKVPHATFTLASDGYNITDGDDGGFYVWRYLPYKSQKEVTLTWELDDEDNYQIEVKSISFKAKAYVWFSFLGGEAQLSFNNGHFVSVGTATLIPSDGWRDIGGKGTYSSGVKAILKTGADFPHIFDYHFKDFKIQYAIKPVIKTTENNKVAVTICDDNRQYLDLASCITNKSVLDAHITSYEYELYGDNPAGGYISDNKFYAVNTGTYTVRIKANYKDACHFTGDTLMTITVTPATLSLTAPTASDIIYHQTLGESVLTGGKASVGSCEVTGTWAWKYPETTPSIGDNQPFPVVFTPSENAGNYTNFETTASVDVKRAQYIFDGSGDGEGDEWWCEHDNWNVGAAPSIEDEVLVQHNVLIACEVYAYSVEIAEGKTITIAPEGGLTVGAGGIIGANRNNLILKAGTEGETKGKTGYLRISPEYTGAMPEATVEIYTIGYYNMNVGNHQDVGTWQYVGSPMVNDGTLARNVFTKNMLYDWNEATGEWKNNLRRLVLQPFIGYATSQYNEEGRLVTNQGQLVDNGVVVLPLTYTESSATPGCNVLANSFSAPIDISRIETTDFSEGVDATIHLFNTGSKMDVEALSEKKSVASIDVNAAGQYLSIPVINAKTLNSEFGYPILIPSMQGFYVNTDRAGTLTLDYEKLVWNANLKASPNIPLRAPKRSIEEEQTISGALQVTLTTDGMTDNLFLLEAEHYDASFENGLDARKKMSCAFNIFAIEDSAQLAVDATNSIIGTRVGVRTGDETAYTLVFSHLKTENALALLDNETEETIDINEGLEYTFFAEPNSVITERFQIVERANAPAVATGTENAKNGVKAHKFIKDGQLYVLKNGVLYNAMGAVVR